MFYLVFISLVCFFAPTQALFKAITIGPIRRSPLSLSSSRVLVHQHRAFAAQPFVQLADSKQKLIEKALRKVINNKVLEEMLKDARKDALDMEKTLKVSTEVSDRLRDSLVKAVWFRGGAPEMAYYIRAMENERLVRDSKLFKKEGQSMNIDLKPGIYEHYKGKRYQVIGIGNHTETLEKLVFYRALYDTPDFGNQPLWVRPVAMFTGEVTIDGKTIPRFTYITSE